MAKYIDCVVFPVALGTDTSANTTPTLKAVGTPYTVSCAIKDDADATFKDYDVRELSPAPALTETLQEIFDRAKAALVAAGKL